MLVKSIFPSGYNLVEQDKDLFLLQTHYYKYTDQLFNIYKRYSTGEKILKIINNPKVPVFISNRKLTKHQEFIHLADARRVMVSYKNKEEEVKAQVFPAKEITYRDKNTGRWIKKIVYPNVIPGAVTLNPNVFFFDIPIEHVVMLEYALNHYEQQNGLLYEKIPIPNLNVCGFDIETHQLEDGTWVINTNTFINPEANKAFIDVVRNKHFNRIDEMESNVEKFKEDTRNTMREMIKGCSLKGSSKDFVQKLSYDFIDNVDIIVTFFDNEAELIKATCKRMFTDYQPDILVAFNATYDIGMFLDRIRALGLPAGTFNELGIGFNDVQPPADNQCRSNATEDRPFKGDDFNPVKRVVYFNNISHTLIADSQTCFFSNRSTQTFSNVKLQTAAENILGYGKLDYTHITNTITNLAETDFWFHSKYAIIDSILLVLMEKVAKDFQSKLIYCMSCKVNIEESPRNNSAITRGIFADCVVRGYIPGNNLNKICGSMSKEDLHKIETLLEVHYLTKIKDAVSFKPKYGGGIVLQPGLYNYNLDIAHYNEIGKEARIHNFRRIFNACYLDFKSHYPSQTVANNLSKDTLFGNIRQVMRANGDTVLAADRTLDTFTGVNRKHLGSINLATVSRDPISFGAQCCNLPDMSELIKRTVQFDSEPKFHKEPTVITTLTPASKIAKFVSVLATLNTYNYKNHQGSDKVKSNIDIDEDRIIKKFNSNNDDDDYDTIVFEEEETGDKGIAYIPDTKYFFITNGKLSFNGTYVEYNYTNYDVYSAITNNEATSPLYATINKGELSTHNHKVNIPKQDKFDLSDCELHQISDKDWSHLFEVDFISERSNIFGITTDINRYCFYFPWTHYIKQLKLVTPPKITVTTPQYKIKLLDQTAIIGIYYSILGENDLRLDIEQQMQVVRLD